MNEVAEWDAGGGAESLAGVESFEITTSSPSLLQASQGKSILEGVVVQEISTHRGNMGLANGLGGVRSAREGHPFL